ncbi:MAG: non-canonical purine NTP pyrophosphatase, partial [Ignavibacteria bacterium]|nr:non-canonical purine NTP pyrophosphatase [Ignavibacteria bacterium]
IADDSGLMVELLDGKPGVHSARYAGPNCSYADNNLKLLKELRNKPKPHRAKFVSIISVKSDNFDEIFEGYMEGEIIDEPRGKNGFGYDPVFKPNGYDLTYAELSSEEKNKISHRAKSLKKLKEFLSTQFLV